MKGFKSFPERVSLEFSPGVSVIVGPNGSGKSNITDAVLWALGEQSPGAIRGASMQDVISAGGKNTGQRREAQVEKDMFQGGAAVAAIHAASPRKSAARNGKPWSRGDNPATGSGHALSGETRGEEEFAGLRAYAPGIALKHMAWKVLARGGEAAVQSYTSLASQPDWLEWSSLEGQETEMRLSQLCLWVLESDAAQRVFGLRIPGKEIPPAAGAAHRFACLRALAVFGSEEPR